MSMINFSKYDFTVDFNFDEQIQKTVLIEQKKNQEVKKQQDIRESRKRAGSEMRPVKTKKGKEDCKIY